jgi:hypothetical protein
MEALRLAYTKAATTMNVYESTLQAHFKVFQMVMKQEPRLAIAV